MTDLEILELLVRAKEAGISLEDIEKFKAQRVVPLETVPETSAHDIVKPLSTWEEVDAELVQYWATPYAEEIIAKREAQIKKSNGEIE